MCVLGSSLTANFYSVSTKRHCKATQVRCDEAIQVLYSLQQSASCRLLSFRHVFPFDNICVSGMFAMETGQSVPVMRESVGVQT